MVMRIGTWRELDRLQSISRSKQWCKGLAPFAMKQGRWTTVCHRGKFDVAYPRAFTDTVVSLLPPSLGAWTWKDDSRWLESDPHRAEPAAKSQAHGAQPAAQQPLLPPLHAPRSAPGIAARCEREAKRCCTTEESALAELCAGPEDADVDNLCGSDVEVVSVSGPPLRRD